MGYLAVTRDRLVNYLAKYKRSTWLSLHILDILCSRGKQEQFIANGSELTCYQGPLVGKLGRIES